MYRGLYQINVLMGVLNGEVSPAESLYIIPNNKEQFKPTSLKRNDARVVQLVEYFSKNQRLFNAILKTNFMHFVFSQAKESLLKACEVSRKTFENLAKHEKQARLVRAKIQSTSKNRAAPDIRGVFAESAKGRHDLETIETLKSNADLVLTKLGEQYYQINPDKKPEVKLKSGKNTEKNRKKREKQKANLVEKIVVKTSEAELKRQLDDQERRQEVPRPQITAVQDFSHLDLPGAPDHPIQVGRSGMKQTEVK